MVFGLLNQAVIEAMKQQQLNQSTNAQQKNIQGKPNVEKERQSENSKQQTANSKQQTANSKQQTANSKQQTANSKQPNPIRKTLTMMEPLNKHAYAELKKALIQQLNSESLWWVDGKNYLLDISQKLIWNADKAQAEQNTRQLEDIKYSGFLIFERDTNLPTASQLHTFARYTNNPLRKGTRFQLWERYAWKAIENGYVYQIDLDDGCNGTRNGQGSHTCLWVDRSLAKDLSSFIDFLVKRKRSISSIAAPNINLLEPLINIPLNEALRDIDYYRCRLPRLEDRRFTDVNQGLWEFWGKQHLLQGSDIRARNPADDIQPGNIGIDFGTSSTVVAYEDKNGRAKLLRIGVKDFFEAAQPEHYENPTVLEFVDFTKFQQAWQQEAYQPLVSWDNVRCSHEAQANFRENDTDPSVVGSILPKIKQWALREAQDAPLRITDRQGVEHELAHLALSNPVKGQKLTVNSQYAFDPVELYAWFLGLNINWRNRGIFLKYYMTFPVAYPKAVKEKILASFRRGLLRSLPESLTSNADVISKFAVEERASEPAAYAAVAMKALGIEPPDDDKGIAYAVFDFGGGTTDFDYGYYRWANEEEEAKGIEEVFEHFESNGDKFLGGENLLENLAYLVFKANVDICREKRIAFTKPLDADDFSGSEMLIERTQAAHTNTLMLMSILRNYWQKGEISSSGVARLNLLNRDGEEQACELSLYKDELDNYLEERIARGIENFFVGIKKAFGNEMPKEVHILLAGNSSRSKLVTDSFWLTEDNPANEERANEIEERGERTERLVNKLFGKDQVEFITYQPLEGNENGGEEADNEYSESKPTAKTGVALGILRLCPGSVVKVINRNTASGEAPFAHFVGRIRRGKFQPGIKRNDPYRHWAEIGVVSEDNAFNLYHTTSPLAFQGEMREGNSELYRRAMMFAANSAGQKVFARAVSPDVIEICTAETLEQAGNNNLQEMNLSR